ncbi:hypothetical protein [Sinomonas sp. ASV322]|uniref:hypothetical protein n=1 Tax=Sinomonas sp. ASV322 TaxID=3041920 RepID=UPI0027DC9E3E|nr:hypothetical protein [Sinomonas sp. ASV322]MDQ4504272.1 hypothetical protein [Sinomonas sp. ASV322]
MTIKSFDRTVAEAHGFRIETSASGEEMSIPVTAEAKAVQSNAEAAAAKDARSTGREIKPFGSAEGNCGSSFVSAKKYSGDWLGVSTGYSVYGTVIDRSWYVNGVGAITSNTIYFQGGSTPSTWSGTGGATVVGPGYAVVPFTAHVILSNGGVCYSNAPIDFFG